MAPCPHLVSPDELTVTGHWETEPRHYTTGRSLGSCPEWVWQQQGDRRGGEKWRQEIWTSVQTETGSEREESNMRARERERGLKKRRNKRRRVRYPSQGERESECDLRRWWMSRRVWVLTWGSSSIPRPCLFSLHPLPHPCHPCVTHVSPMSQPSLLLSYKPLYSCGTPCFAPYSTSGSPSYKYLQGYQYGHALWQRGGVCVFWGVVSLRVRQHAN